MNWRDVGRWVGRGRSGRPDFLSRVLSWSGRRGFSGALITYMCLETARTGRGKVFRELRALQFAQRAGKPRNARTDWRGNDGSSCDDRGPELVLVVNAGRQMVVRFQSDGQGLQVSGGSRHEDGFGQRDETG